jgi:hypothetical protein
MSPQYSEDDFTETKARPKGHIPHLPDRDVSFSTLRQWVSDALGLPPTVRVDGVIRQGRGEDDPLSITLSNDMVIRCDRQKRLHSAATFVALLTSESDGLCRPKSLNRPEVEDVYNALCTLATTVAVQDELSELHERLDGFVNMCESVHLSVTPDYRYSNLRRIQKRDEYDRNAATAGKQGRVIVRPVLIADHEWGAYLIRHSEFITHLRVVHMQSVADNYLKGRMAELGCEYHSLQAHGPAKRGHVQLAFYKLSEDMSVPHRGDE